MREVIADYPAEDVYSTKRQEIQDKIRGRAEAMLGEKMMDRSGDRGLRALRIPLYAMLNLIDTLILGIELPPPLSRPSIARSSSTISPRNTSSGWSAK